MRRMAIGHWRRSVVVAAITTMSLGTLGACGLDDGEDQSVVWVDRACGIVGTMIVEDPTVGDVPSGGDAATVKAGLLEHLTKEIEFLDARLAEINDLGRAPMDGGDNLVDTLRTTVTQMSEGFRAAKDKIDKADIDDPAAFQASREEAMAELREVADRARTAGTEINRTAKAHEAVDTAWKRAKTCKVLSEPDR